MTTPGTHRDPLANLREYRQLAPWSLRDLASLAGAILESASIRPLNAAASPRPSERTIRFYVTRNLVTPPEGRGTAATYSYRHLLQVLTIKLRQMEGATLSGIRQELAETTGDVLERRVAAVLGEGLPSPGELPTLGDEEWPRGRSGQRLRGATAVAEPAPDRNSVSRAWQRIAVTDGVELHVRDDHPVAAHPGLDGPLAEAVRLAVGRLLSRPTPSRAATDEQQPERRTNLA
ncbi:MAG: MerR family transcriptional regulator [Gemmatimonadales bacterium]|jgi:DNA-binding transcriptional MerR regulator